MEYYIFMLLFHGLKLKKKINNKNWKEVPSSGFKKGAWIEDSDLETHTEQHTRK